MKIIAIAMNKDKIDALREKIPSIKTIRCDFSTELGNNESKYIEDEINQITN